MVIVLSQDEWFKADRQSDGAYLILTCPVSFLETREETELEKFDRMKRSLEPWRVMTPEMGHA